MVDSLLVCLGLVAYEIGVFSKRSLSSSFVIRWNVQSLSLPSRDLSVRETSVSDEEVSRVTYPDTVCDWSRFKAMMCSWVVFARVLQSTTHATRVELQCFVSLQGVLTPIGFTFNIHIICGQDASPINYPGAGRELNWTTDFEHSRQSMQRNGTIANYLYWNWNCPMTKVIMCRIDLEKTIQNFYSHCFSNCTFLLFSLRLHP